MKQEIRAQPLARRRERLIGRLNEGENGRGTSPLSSGGFCGVEQISSSQDGFGDVNRGSLLAADLLILSVGMGPPGLLQWKSEKENDEEKE